MIAFKTCVVCHESKPLSPEFFNRDNQRIDGYHSYCKVCHRNYKVGSRLRKKAPSNGEYRHCTQCNRYLEVNDSNFYKSKIRYLAICKQCACLNRKGRYISEKKHRLKRVLEVLNEKM